MVRVTNIFGDITTGKSGEAVYQRKYGRGMRRLYKEVKPSSSPGQKEQNDNFKHTIAWIKTLTFQEKQAVKRYYTDKKIGVNNGEPIHWYNWLKNLGLKKPLYRIMNENTGVYQIKHDAIYSVEEIDNKGNVINIVENLSDILDSRYLGVFQQKPSDLAVKVKLTILPGLTYEYPVQAIAPHIISFPCHS